MNNMNQLVLSTLMMQGHNRNLTELQQFRRDPASIIPYLKDRLSRYKHHEGSSYLFSRIHKKKALQANQLQIQSRVNQLISTFSESVPPFPQLILIPKLDEIASKLCQTLEPQMSTQLTFKPDSSKILRQALNEDSKWIFPNSVTCLIALSFDEPYEPLVSLLVDDGLPDRANCKALMDRGMRYLGLASLVCRSQPELRCTVFVMTDEIIAKGEMQVQNGISYVQGQPQVISSVQPQPSIQSINSVNSINSVKTFHQNQKLSKIDSIQSSNNLQPIPHQPQIPQNHFNQHIVPLQGNQRPITFNQMPIGDTNPIKMVPDQQFITPRIQTLQNSII